MDTYAETLKPLYGDQATGADYTTVSICEAGVGEGTTLASLYNRLPKSQWHGFDLSPERIRVAAAFLTALGLEAKVFEGSYLDESPAPNQFDIVYTSHSLEPSMGREVEGIRNLARRSRRWVVLFEPCYELAPPEAQARMERLGYVRGLEKAGYEAGVAWQEIRPIQTVLNPLNPTTLFLGELR